MKYPSCGDGLIVYQHGADLELLDTATGTTRRLPVVIPSDRRHVRTELVTPAPATGAFGLSPAGERVLIEARGEILNLPADKGDPVNLTRTSASRERNAAWSPKGDQVVFCSDRTGEEQLYLVDQHGTGDWRQLTNGNYGFTLPPVWSPDGKSVLFADKFLALHLVDVASGKTTKIAQSGYDDAWERWGVQDYVWSPDSRWVAYSDQTANMNEIIRLYDTRTGKTYDVTDAMAESWSPSFSRDGKYLFFLSNRTFNPIMGRQDQNHVFLKMARPYVVILQDGERSPFYSDDTAAAVGDGGDKDKKDKEDKKAADVTVDPEGLAARTVACEGVDPGNWFRLEAIDGGFLMLRKDEPEFLKYQNVNDGTGGRLELVKYDLKDAETSDILADIANYHLSADGKKLIYRAGAKYGVVDAAKGGKVGDGAVDPGAAEAEGGPPAGVLADVRRGLAHRAELVLRQEHAGRRLEGHVRQVPALRPGLRHPRRPELPDRRDDRRAQPGPHLRLRRRQRRRRAQRADRPAWAATSPSTRTRTTTASRTSCRACPGIPPTAHPWPSRACR